MDERTKVKFLSKVDSTGDPEACWEWKAPLGGRGYGQFKHQGRTVKAHRVSYELFVGPIPEGEGYHGTCVCHRCDNRKCVNPAHLFLGAHDENMRDRGEKGRGNQAKGSGRANSKLTEADVKTIKLALQMGIAGSHLARRFGISNSVIYGIKAGHSWGHVH